MNSCECPYCGGTGQTTYYNASGDLVYEDCYDCDGTGWIDDSWEYDDGWGVDEPDPLEEDDIDEDQ